jgi:hypothetical protein
MVSLQTRRLSMVARWVVGLSYDSFNSSRLEVDRHESHNCRISREFHPVARTPTRMGIEVTTYSPEPEVFISMRGL